MREGDSGGEGGEGGKGAHVKRRGHQTEAAAVVEHRLEGEGEGLGVGEGVNFGWGGGGVVVCAKKRGWRMVLSGNKEWGPSPWSPTSPSSTGMLLQQVSEGLLRLLEVAKEG